MIPDEHPEEVWCRALASLASTGETVCPDCPAPEAIFDAAWGALSENEVAPLVAHGIECPACAEAWRLAHHARDEARRTSEHAIGIRRWTPARLGWTAVAAVAATVAVSGIILQVMSVQPAPPGVYRSTHQEVIRSRRSADGPCRVHDCLLRWQGPEGARYRVWLATPDLDILWTSEALEDTHCQVPPTVLDSLPAGASLLWRVE
ncbi:MAG: hypothetical protein ACE5IK_12520, partial [Acidobacteriota bacterium]